MATDNKASRKTIEEKIALILKIWPKLVIGGICVIALVALIIELNSSTDPLVALKTIFLVIIIYIAILVFIHLLDKKYKRQLDFYNKCKAKGITDFTLSSPRDLERAKLIAQELNLEFKSDDKLREMMAKLEDNKLTQENKVKQDKINKEKEKEERVKDEALRAEQRSLKSYSKYAGLSAKEKRLEYVRQFENEYLKMASDEKAKAKKYESEARMMEFRIDRAYKETNPYAAGGLADGLAGPGAGLAAFHKTEQENAQKRADKAVVYEAAKPLINSTWRSSQSAASSASSYKDQAAKYAALYENINISLEQKADTQILNKLSFSDLYIIKISDHVAEVNVIAKAKEALTVYDNPAVCDGSITADVSADGRSIGECVMVIDSTWPITDYAITPLKGALYIENDIDKIISSTKELAAEYDASNLYLIEAEWEYEPGKVMTSNLLKKKAAEYTSKS